MSDYTPISDYEVKDSLAHLDPEKIVSGAELQAEFDAIAASLRSKVGTTFNMISAIQTTEVAQVLLDLVYKPGMIKPWYGSTLDIPSGWGLCDGTNGTPDLRDKFIVGAGGSYNLSATGGATTTVSGSSGTHTHTGVTGETSLTEADLPLHHHDIWAANNSGNTDADGWEKAGTRGIPGEDNGPFAYRENSNTGDQLIGDAGSASPAGHAHIIGSDGAHTHTVATLPPYYGLYYIMYLGFDTEAGIGNTDSPLPSGRPMLIQLACSDLTTTLTTGTMRAYVRAAASFTVDEVRASLATASSSGAVIVDINQNGTSILSTKLSVDASETTSTTAATPAVFSSTSIGDDDLLTIDIDNAGSGAKGLIVTIIGTVVG